MAAGRGPCSDMNWDNKEAECRTAMAVNQDHGKGFLQKLQVIGLIKSAEMDRWEVEEDAGNASSESEA
jgi:hypothetical protein